MARSWTKLGTMVGEGIPPLAGSDILKDRKRTMDAVVHGLSSPITVRGKSFSSEMPPSDLSDRDLADVLTCALNQWANPGGTVSPEEVGASRRSH